MKTKTIYHLDQDCNIVKIEVIKKDRKKKPSPDRSVSSESLAFKTTNEYKTAERLFKYLLKDKSKSSVCEIMKRLGFRRSTISRVLQTHSHYIG